MIRATRQDTVKVHYIGRLADGTIFDQSPAERPLHFIIGRNEVIEGFDEAVVDMYQGTRKTVTIPAAKAYGPVREELFEVLERAQLPPGLELKVGGRLEITRQDGSTFHVAIRELTAETVTLDANHPLAGHDLTFDIELLEVKKHQATPAAPPKPIH